MNPFIRSITHGIKSVLPEKLKFFLEYTHRRKQLPNLFIPRDYSEYIFRDILFNKYHQYVMLADKYNARKFIERKGLGFLLPTLYGTWETANDIEFDNLPESFVLKCNHSCGMTIVCPNKSELNRSNAIDLLNKWLKTKHPIYFEGHYRKIKPIIMCEEYIRDSQNMLPIDYKLHCVHGEPLFFLVCYDRILNVSTKLMTFDLAWNQVDFLSDGKWKNNNAQKPDPPKNLTKMIEYGRLLSQGITQVRIDFYDTGTKLYFGEYTFTPQGGWLDYYSSDTLKFIRDKIMRIPRT